MVNLAFNLVLMAVLLIWAARELNRDFTKGLCLALALFVLIPRSLRIETSGVIPELTFDRFLLGIIFLYWLKQDHRPIASVPFLRTLIFLAAANFISLIISTEHADSFKSFLSFIIEGLGFYIIISTSLTDEASIRKAIYAVCCSLFIVAIPGVIEKYTRINLVSLIMTTDLRPGDDRGVGRGIMSTYPHRILFGYAMAMGVPLALWLLSEAKARRQKIFRWTLLLLLVGACYFSVSRGAWLGMVVAIGGLSILGSKPLRKPIVIIACLAGFILVARPGVKDTIVNLASSSFQEDSIQGSSYQYRWKLWHVAWGEITKSPERFLFGYGGLSTESMDLSYYFERQAGGTTTLIGYTSWDNQYASDLIEFGFIGIAIEFLFYVGVLFALFGIWRGSQKIERGRIAAILSSCAVYLFAMSNVFIFSPQLKFLFWTVVALGMNMGRLQSEETEITEESPARGELSEEPVWV